MDDDQTTHPLDREGATPPYINRLIDTYERELEDSFKVLDALPDKYLKALIRMMYYHYWMNSRAATNVDTSDTYAMIEANTKAHMAMTLAYEFEAILDAKTRKGEDE